MRKLRGTYTVIVTPFTEDGSAIDETMLRWLVDYQIAEGIHGLIPLASNGELLSLSDEERHQVARLTIEQAAGRVPVVVSTTHESTDFAIRYTRDAEALGADAAMVMTPVLRLDRRGGGLHPLPAHRRSGLHPDHALQPPGLDGPRHEAAPDRATGRDRQHRLHQGVHHGHPPGLPDQRPLRGQDDRLRRLPGLRVLHGRGGGVGVRLRQHHAAQVGPHVRAGRGRGRPPWRLGGLQGAGPGDRLAGGSPLRPRHEGGPSSSSTAAWGRPARPAAPCRPGRSRNCAR